MSKDLRGIYQYEETDDEATFSELLNLGMQSVSDALAYFAGTSAQREALDPAPPGAKWQDTDNGERLWSAGPTGKWRRHEGIVTSPAAAWNTSQTPCHGRVVSAVLPTVLAVDETLALTVVAAGAPYAAVSLAAVTRGPTSTTIDARFMAFGSATIAAVTLSWRVVKAVA